MSSGASGSPVVLVFDLGGVLFDFQGAALIASHSRRGLSPAEVRQSWVPLVRSFEIGECSEAEFAEAAVRTYELTLAPRAFLVAFRDAAAGFYQGALSLVAALRQNYRVVSLSNTNRVQWPAVLAALTSGDPFHAHHPSHLSGFHKPDRRAYDAVARLGGQDALLLLRRQSRKRSWSSRGRLVRSAGAGRPGSPRGLLGMGLTSRRVIVLRRLLPRHLHSTASPLELPRVRSDAHCPSPRCDRPIRASVGR